MSDNKQHIDDLFRKEFDGFELPVSAADFAAVQAGLTKKKKRRPFLWWFVFALIAGIALFFIRDFNGDSAVSDNNQSKIESVRNHPKRKLSKDQVHSPEQNKQNDIADQDMVVADIDMGQNQESLFGDQNNEARQAAEPKSQPQPGFEPATPDSGNDRASDTDEDMSEENDEDDEWVEGDGGDERNDVPRTSQIKDGRDNEKEAEARKKEQEEIERRKAEERKEAERARLEEEKKRKEAEEAARKLEQELREKEAQKADSSSKTKVNIAPVLPVSPLTYRVGAAIQYGVTSQSLSQENTAHASYSAYKGSNEQNKFSLNTELVLQAVYKNSWELQAGFNYSQYEFEQPRIKYQLKDSFPFKNPRGDTLYYIYRNYRDTVVKPPTSRLRYSTISVPIRIGKVIELGPKTTLYAQLGGQLSMITKTEGYTVTSALDIREASKLPIRDFEVGWNTALGVAYEIKPQWLIRGDLSYQNLSGNLYESTYDAKAVLSNTGFKLSLMYEFGKEK